MAAGLAKTSSFLLGTATIMLGPLTDLWDLTPAIHSLGLVKNFQIMAEPHTVELTQGIRNTIVYSVLTGNKVTAQGEVFEYTSKNLMYGLGLDGTSFVAFPNEYLTNAVLTGASTPVTTATFVSATDVTAAFAIGQWISIQDAVFPDFTHIAKLTAATTVTGTAPTIIHTVIFVNHGLKTGNNFAIGSKVQLMNQVRVGSIEAQPFFACKVVGILPEKNEPVVILMPKVRITRGFTVLFGTENYGNLPFQIQPYDLVPADANYTEFNGIGSAMLMTPT